MKKFLSKTHEIYLMFIAMYVLFVILAFIFNRPAELLEGFRNIMVSRSVLITDYIAEGGIGATLINVSLVGGCSLIMLMRSNIKPNGSTMMALWLTTGFAFFGKNIFNMLPITFGVWIYSKVQKEPFIRYTLVALLSATISPAVSEIAFLDIGNTAQNIMMGVLLGIFVGFIFPMVAAFTVRFHEGYNLYNMGFAGGLISVFIVSILQSIGIKITPKESWSSGNNLSLSILLFTISLFLLIYGFVRSGREKALSDLVLMTRHSGRLATDYYMMFRRSAYVNMGLLGLFSTSAVLILDGDINGPTISGIFCIIGFGCFGKNIYNIVPVMVGAIISTYVNQWDPTSPLNMLAVLFCTALAPIAGQFGWAWGALAGFLHVNFAIHVGHLNSGLNLYNNGFGATFIAMILIPIITGLKRNPRNLEEKL